MIQTVSLKTAILLKENGFPQNSIHLHWIKSWGNGAPEREPFYTTHIIDLATDRHKICAAAETDELIEQLPTIIYGGFTISIWRMPNGNFVVGYVAKNTVCDNSPVFSDKLFFHYILPEALAQMWLWLKKEGLIK